MASYFFRDLYILYYEKTYFKEDFIMATWKQIETSREIRLWISQIVMPAATFAAAAMAIPEVRHAVTEKAKSIKASVDKKFKKN